MNKNRNISYNYKIDFFRFWLTICILLFHGYYFIFVKDQRFIPFINGNIAVEGFFILTGIFMAKEVLNDKETQILKFLLKKIKKLIPVFLYTYFICAILEVISVVTSGKSLFNLLPGIIDLLFLQSAGIPSARINTATWYISAMLFACAILYPILKKYRENLCLVFAPILAALVYGVMYQFYGSITVVYLEQNPYICVGGLPRAIAGLLLGFFVYSVSIKLERIKFYFIPKIIIEMFGILFFGLSVVYMFDTKINSNYEPVIIFFWVYISILLYSRQFFIINIKKTICLADFSMAIYLNQFYCYYLVNHFGKSLSGWAQWSLYILVTFVASLLSLKISKIIKVLIEKKISYKIEEVEDEKVI